MRLFLIILILFLVGCINDGGGYYVNDMRGSQDEFVRRQMLHEMRQQTVMMREAQEVVDRSERMRGVFSSKGYCLHH